MDMLTSLELRGWKSIRELRADDLKLGRLNVLIGANGSGKSNLISFFRLLGAFARSPGELQLGVVRSGGANAVLHDGAAKTPELAATLRFETETGHNDYAFRLVSGAPDRLVFAEEKYRAIGVSTGADAGWISLGSAHEESKLGQAADVTSTKIHQHL